MKTIAHEFLDIESEDFEVPQSCYDTLDDILEKARERIDIDDEPRKILESIGRVLREDGFITKENGLLSHGLQTKEIDCKHYSALYYSIAEELGLPLNIVSAPEHVFIRWDNEENTFDWETTTNLEVTDDYYVRAFNISKKSISKGVYLKNLTKKEIKATAYVTCAFIKQEKGDLEEALSYYNKSIELNPHLVEAYINRADIKRKRGCPDGAILDYTKAIKLNPNYAHAYNNRGATKHNKLDFKGAISDYTKAIELEPDNADFYLNRKKARVERGDIKKAEKDIEMWRKLTFKTLKQNETQNKH